MLLPPPPLKGEGEGEGERHGHAETVADAKGRESVQQTKTRGIAHSATWQSITW
jgi:hypothetical protein